MRRYCSERHISFIMFTKPYSLVQPSTSTVKSVGWHVKVRICCCCYGLGFVSVVVKYHIGDQTLSVTRNSNGHSSVTRSSTHAVVLKTPLSSRVTSRPFLPSDILPFYPLTLSTTCHSLFLPFPSSMILVFYLSSIKLQIHNI